MLETLNGGWKIIKTMGHKIFKMQPAHGFAAQSATAGVILTASLLGAPISTTQVISSSILRVGSSKRFSAHVLFIVLDSCFASYYSDMLREKASGQAGSG